MWNRPQYSKSFWCRNKCSSIVYLSKDVVSNWPHAISGGRADSVMDSHATGPGSKIRWGRYTFYRASDWLPPYQLHKVERVCKVVGRFPCRIWPKTLKRVVVHCSMTFHIHAYHNDRSAPCLYTVTGRYAMSCVYGIAFLYGSTLVPRLLAGAVTIWLQM